MVYAKVVSGLGYLKNKQRSLANQFKLQNNKTFIVPTGFGFAFGGISFVLLVMAIGYANNLLYFFVFLLISIALSGMWLTNKNVDSFQMNGISWVNIFAQQENQIEVQMQNLNSKISLWDIDLSVYDKINLSPICKVDEVQILTKASLLWKPLSRGRQKSPRILIQSRFPFGMLRAWKYYENTNEVIVYPELKGQKSLPFIEANQSDDDLNSQAETHGLFRDFREFQKSDSPNRIDWKRSLKHQKHFVKNFEASGEKKILIDWSFTKGLHSFETRLSQMALWVDVCHKKNELYSLKINKYQTEYSNRPSHYKECMQKLALLKIEETL